MSNPRISQPDVATPDDNNLGYVIALVLIETLLVAWLYWERVTFATTREFLRAHIVWTLFGAAMLVAVAWGGVRVALQRKWMRSTNARLTVTLFGLVPALLLVGLLISNLLPLPNQIAAFRTFFIMFACFFPVALYYLFIVARKHSLLNEYLNNLSRLGLLKPRELTPLSSNGPSVHETDVDVRRRVVSYLQRFEAVYGPIASRIRDAVATNQVPVGQLIADLELGGATRTGGEGFSLARETRVPLVHAALLLVLGWLLVLPPWEPPVPEGRAETKVVAVTGTMEKLAVAAPVTPEDSARIAAAALAAEDAARSKRSVDAVENLPNVLRPQSSAPLFAFLGAYFFMVQLLFRRSVRRDLRATVYTSVSLRIIIAVVGAWVLEAAARVLFDNPNPAAIDVMAFAIGAFPPLLWEVIAAVFKKIGVVVLPRLETKMPVSDLDGVSVWQAARLEEEDIESIPNMANADLADLMLSTRFPPERIVDWVDQSILYTHLGPVPDTGGNGLRGALTACGIRTASGLVEAFAPRRVKTAMPIPIDKALGTYADAAKVLGGVLKAHPNLDLVMTWRGL